MCSSSHFPTTSNHLVDNPGSPEEPEPGPGGVGRIGSEVGWLASNAVSSQQLQLQPPEVARHTRRDTTEGNFSLVCSYEHPPCSDSGSCDPRTASTPRSQLKQSKWGRHQLTPGRLALRSPQTCAFPNPQLKPNSSPDNHETSTPSFLCEIPWAQIETIPVRYRRQAAAGNPRNAYSGADQSRQSDQRLGSAAATSASNSATRGLITSSPRRVVARSIAPPIPIPSTRKALISTAKMAELRSTVSPELLASVRDFWFEHVTNEDDLILPSQDVFMPWFAGGEFDKRCVQKFHAYLDAIKATGIDNGDDLLKVVDPQSPLDWLSLVLLLDQMPRNCYRGDESKIVFNYFDHISLGVAQAAAAKQISAVPEIRWVLGRRFWFNLPFTHSESVEMHEKATEGCELLTKDMVDLLEHPEVEGQDEHRARAAQLFKGQDEKVRSIAEMTAKAEKDHFDIIKQFGRYPHRNKPLGREPTAEEVKFLADGGATFAPPPPKEEQA